MRVIILLSFMLILLIHHPAVAKIPKGIGGLKLGMSLRKFQSWIQKTKKSRNWNRSKMPSFTYDVINSNTRPLCSYKVFPLYEIDSKKDYTHWEFHFYKKRLFLILKSLAVSTARIRVASILKKRKINAFEKAVRKKYGRERVKRIDRENYLTMHRSRSREIWLHYNIDSSYILWIDKLYLIDRRLFRKIKRCEKKARKSLNKQSAKNKTSGLP